MPKPLREYTWREIYRFRPALHWKREWQRRLRVALETRASDAGRRAKDIVPMLAARKVLITVAFNYSDTIAVQGELLRRHVGDGPWLVVDNSADADAAEEIAAAARRFDAYYVRLPAQRWAKLLPNERHGAAMNWTWRNIIKPARPQAFGFLDHDIYPLTPTDPFAALERFPIAGVVTSHLNEVGRWHLWAGFAFSTTPSCAAGAWISTMTLPICSTPGASIGARSTGTSIVQRCPIPAGFGSR